MKAPVDFLSQLLENTLRARILKLFLNAPETPFTSEEVRKRIQAGSKKTIRKELVRLERIKVVRAHREARVLGRSLARKGQQSEQMWILNAESSFMLPLRAFVRSVGLGDDAEPKLLEKLRHAGRLRLVVVSAAFVDGGEGEAKIDVLLVGESFHEKKLEAILRGVEAERGREIRYAAFSPKEYAYRLDVQDRLIRDLLDYPHRILLDRL